MFPARLLFPLAIDNAMVCPQPCLVLLGVVCFASIVECATTEKQPLYRHEVFSTASAQIY